MWVVLTFIYFFIETVIVAVSTTDTSGNETVTANDIIQFLNQSNFDIYADHWNEQGYGDGAMMIAAIDGVGSMIIIIIINSFPL